MMKNITGLLLLVLIIMGCEKTIDPNYQSNPPKMVIEGNITDQPGPYVVKISKSIGLSQPGNYPVVNDALVTISDDAGNNEVLVGQGNGIYHTNMLVGTPGRTYTLTVKADNLVYTSTSTMPQRVPFDAIKIEDVNFMSEIEHHIIPVYTDPVVKGNNYRFVVSVNNRLIPQHFVQTDEVKNGVVNTFRLELDDDHVKLALGDLVEIQMQCIDSKVALYYTALALMADSGPGGGTTPNNPPGNISDDALGVFSTHTTEKRSVIIQ